MSAPDPGLAAVEAACDRAGMDRDDPLRAALVASAGVAARAARAVDGALEASGQEMARAVGERVAAVADAALRRREGARARRGLAAALAAGALLGAGALALGHAWGRRAERAEAAAAQGELAAAAARLDPAAVRAWAGLVRANDVAAALARCPAGEAACALPVWVPRPGAPPPPPAGTARPRA